MEKCINQAMYILNKRLKELLNLKLVFFKLNNKDSKTASSKPVYFLNSDVEPCF